MKFETLREEAEAVAERLRELKYDEVRFIVMNDDVVYSVDKKKFIFMEDLPQEFDKGDYTAFDWATCKAKEFKNEI
jgi:hypothetical protein